MSGYQDGPQDSSYVRRSAIIREMVEKIRDSNKASKVFRSIHESNEDRNGYYDSMHEDDMIIEEDMLNPISFGASNNMDNLS